MMAKPKPFDLSSQAFKRDPMPVFDEMRNRGAVVPFDFPIFGKLWLAVTHEAAAAVLKNEQDFVREPKNAGLKDHTYIRWWMPNFFLVLQDNMLGYDNPDHKRLRGLVDQAFARRGIEDLRRNIEEIADDLLDRMAEKSEADIVAALARDLPLTVICELLGLPQEDQPKFKKWAGGITGATNAFGIIRMLPGVFRLIRYLKGKFAEARVSPQEGLITALVEAEEEGDTLTENELLSMVFLLFFAGHETTVHLIGDAVLALLQHDEQKQKLLDDWDRLPLVVEECLRYCSPVQMTKPRYAARDLELAGHPLSQGENVIALIAAANCDPEKFDEPHRFDTERRPNPHLSFGTGIHFCLGIQLARAETQIALQRLFTRFPKLELAVDETNLEWHERIGLRGLKALPVRLAP